MRHADPRVATPVDSLDSIAARLGAIVRADVGDARLRATLLLGHGMPVLPLNALIVGPEYQESAVLWAIAKIAARVAGFFVLFA